MPFSSLLESDLITIITLSYLTGGRTQGRSALASACDN